MAVVRKKQDDKYLKALRELITTGAGNRQCFDCGQKGPTYVNMTIGSFVCTRCSGVLRGLTPPHRVKSISMATFTQEELDFLKAHGNDMCAKTWLGLWDPKRAIHQDHRELMIDKYERKRYFLEPASPLKSLASIHNQNGYHNNSSSTNSTSTTASHNNNNNNSVHDQQAQHKIHLTPPTSQRTTANGLHKSASATTTSTTAISRPQQRHQQQQHHNGHQHTHQQQDAFMMNNGGGLNGLNGLVITTNGMKPASSISSTSTGALSDTSSCASNGFGPDADFVADFGSANIYDATTGGSPNVSVASSNGYAKIQPLKQQQQVMSSSPNVSETLSNGYAKMNGFHYNGNNNNVTDNFADFDHAPIYNAAGLPLSNGQQKGSSNNNNNNNTPAEDRYAALKDLDEQLRESKAIAEAAATIVSSAVVDSFANNNNSNNANNHVNPFKSQQLAAAAAAGVAGGANGLLANPFQAQQQQQQQQNTQTNLFGQLTVIPNGYGAGTHTMQQQQQPQQQPPPQGFYNYSNGYATVQGGGIGSNSMYSPLAAAVAVASTNVPPTSNIMLGGGGGVPNGCGFGFGTMQQHQLAATAGGGVGGCFNNPFAATGALNSNNPFL